MARAGKRDHDRLVFVTGLGFVLDALVGRLDATPGVIGARLTGAGFGGCVVALAEPGALDGWDPEPAWCIRPSDGATVQLLP